MTILFWTKNGWLFLTRSLRTTAALFFMVFASVTLLIFLSAVAAGINDAMIRNSVSLFSGHISGFNLSDQIRTETLLVKGVSNVLKRIPERCLLQLNSHYDMITVFTVDPSKEIQSSYLYEKTVEGRFPANNQNDIFISRLTAENLTAKTGDPIHLKGETNGENQTLTVCGLFDTGIEKFDRSYALASGNGKITETKNWHAAIFLNNGVTPDAVMAIYQEKGLPQGLFKSWENLMPDLSQLISLNVVAMNLVTFLVFSVVSIGISCAFAIFILKNLKEYGIMKSMGVTSFETCLLINMEVLILNIFAALTGMVAGSALVFFSASSGIDLSGFTSHNPYFVVSGVIFPRLTGEALLLPPFLAILFGILASIWPTLIVIRKKTAEILRIV
ncbi:MAG: FtsX-like permease family protein [Proteobacteria bacterium]|nr:FtsX-like permease family protein [Pseudomonadota bacterium]